MSTDLKLNVTLAGVGLPLPTIYVIYITLKLSITETMRKVQLDTRLIRESFKDYMLETGPTELQYINHSLIGSHSIQCRIGYKECIGYYELLDSRNYFLKLQELLLLRNTNRQGVFVEFIGVWLDQSEGGSLTIYILFEKLKTTLKELLTCTPFQETVFWNVLLDVSSGMTYLHEKNLVHGNLNYYSLLAKGEEIRLFYRPGQNTSLKAWRQAEEDVDYLFLSPEQIKAHKDISYKFQVSKSDVFNMGNILISLLLANAGSVYANQNMLDKRLEQVQSRYGFNIFFILQKMTRIESQSRLDWYQIAPYVHQLNAKKDKIQPLDFRQGTFQRTEQGESNPINDKLGRKRKLIFGGVKRNLLQSEPKHRNHQVETVTSQGCVTAHCYLKI